MFIASTDGAVSEDEDTHGKNDGLTAVQALRAKRGHTAAVVKSMSEKAVYDVETLHLSLAGKITPALAERLSIYMYRKYIAEALREERMRADVARE